MTKLLMTNAASQGQQGGNPTSPVTLTHTTGPASPSVDRAFRALGSMDAIRQEIADAHADSETFYNREPDEVIRLVAGHSARLSAIRGLIMQIETVHRQWRPVKDEVENALAELREQYAMASRLLFARELDWKIETGGRVT